MAACMVSRCEGEGRYPVLLVRRKTEPTGACLDFQALPCIRAGSIASLPSAARFLRLQNRCLV